MLDLVSPWCAAVEASAGLSSEFRESHASLLNALRLAHTPHLDAFPLLTNARLLRALSQQVTGSVLRNQLDGIVEIAASRGMTPPAQVLLLPTVSLLDPFLALPTNPGIVTLACGTDPLDPRALTVGLARGLALLMRWQGEHARVASPAWDPWELARQMPLREWLYAHGVAWHLAEQIHPELTGPQLFGVSTAAWQRLRQRESSVREELVEEWEQCGIGPVLRWLPADGMIGPTTVNGTTLPSRMGHYLAWRLTAARVARLGLSDALKAAAT